MKTSLGHKRKTTASSGEGYHIFRKKSDPVLGHLDPGSLRAETLSFFWRCLAGAPIPKGRRTDVP
jgi:hypothetical protein